ncbi:MAG: BMP family ABC transporter substrate-binding protein [Fimbriimonadaceae bacterium]|nr:BMP family ABC transporter substrate-binding protein [Fimbriimonadaceae bacterium]
MKTPWTLLFGSLLALVLVGCGDTGGKPAEDAKAPSGDAKPITVGIVFDKGGLGDKSFNDSAWRGVQRAESELGVKVVKVESKSDSDYESNLRTLAEQNCSLVIAVGLGMDQALKNVAPDFPDAKFAIVDGAAEGDNVRALRFKEEEGSFLVGYLAGLMTKSNKIGFVGGMEIPLIKKFEVGFFAGARTANPAVEALPSKYTGSWDEVDKGKAAAEVLFKGGADIVYAAAGRAGLGVIRAAKDLDKFAIGVDSDQDGLEPGNVLTSMIKRVDEAVFSTIRDVKDGKFEKGERMYDLKENGVGISDLLHTKDLIGPEKLAKVDAIKQKVASGEIKVPSTAEEYAAFKP